MFNEGQIEDDIKRIKDDPNLPSPPPSPRAPDLSSVLIPENQKLVIIQKFIESFEYNYTGKPFLQMKKSRGVSHINACAKQIIKAGLPIQCVEAVFLGAYLTSTFKEIERIPLSFKSKFRDNVHRHIVLAIKYDGKWGAIGISRRNNLMYKPIKYNSLHDLVEEYSISYEQCFHRLLTIYVGLPFPFETFSDMPIKWRALKLRIYQNDTDEIKEKLDYYTSNINKINEYYIREGILPPNTGNGKQKSRKKQYNNDKIDKESNDYDTTIITGINELKINNKSNNYTSSKTSSNASSKASDSDQEFTLYE